eukprot:TRINITY_DN3317_c0_g2_i2.p1 TRINITY_DN3317_c0_g2~~TRINITY_DN3317_c0_g2_i2.p1  ORF type:complete len:562 (+),score=151.30 TRINITY_DN3317_c0_g2_i2:282-1967(+)
MCLWQVTPNVGSWIMALLQRVVLHRHGNSELFAEIAGACAASLLNQLLMKSMRTLNKIGPFQVLRALLLSVSHTPHAFHSMAKQIQSVVEGANLRPKNKFAKQFAAFVFTLMDMHKGYPEIYGPLGTCLSKFDEPTEEEIKSIIKQHALVATDGVGLGISLGDEFRSRSSDIGYAGLVNLGNTCYLNSVVQSLFMTHSFRSYLCSRQSVQQNGVLERMQRTFAFLCATGRSAYAPNPLIGVLPEWFVRGAQQDASEYTRYVFDQISTEVEQEDTEDNPITDLFQGKQRSVITCSSCQNESIKEQPFTDIPLTMNGDSLEELLDNFSQPSMLDGDNQYFCESCAEHVDAEKRLEITETGPHVIFSLNRFHYNVETGTMDKLGMHVTYPSLLDIGESQYALYAAIFHAGSSAHVGHYYAYCRPSDLASTMDKDVCTSDTDDHWFLFNDSYVSNSSFGTFKKGFRGDTAYMLMYVRRDMDIVGEPGLQYATSLLSDNLRSLVRQDNLTFQQELQTEWKRKAEKKKRMATIQSVIPSRFNRDNDDYGPGAGGFSHNFLDGGNFIS